MIDVQQVRELIELMVEHGLNEIRVKQGDTVISLRRGPSGEMIYTTAPAAMPASPVGVPLGGGIPSVPPAVSVDEGLIPIKSPMVGTLYLAPDPESPPFVRAGSEIDAHSPICIIEAMKVFNEIKAEVAGTIERVLVHNEQAVEFGQVLMLVRPK